MSSSQRGPNRSEWSPRARPRLVVRLAGGTIGLVGAGNIVLATLAFATDLVRLGTGAAIALLVLGAATMALGLLVATGRRWAMLLALVAFGALFAIQAFGATAGSPAPAAVTLAVVLVPLVLALRTTHPAPDQESGGTWHDSQA